MGGGGGDVAPSVGISGDIVDVLIIWLLLSSSSSSLSSCPVAAVATLTDNTDTADDEELIPVVSIFLKSLTESLFALW